MNSASSMKAKVENKVTEAKDKAANAMKNK